jgi:hypothetical protein
MPVRNKERHRTGRIGWLRAGIGHGRAEHIWMRHAAVNIRLYSPGSLSSKLRLSDSIEVC